MSNIDALIDKLQLQPHPEGGFFRETYRSEQQLSVNCLGKPFDGPRQVCTGIYYLLRSEDFSAFHKINQDEMWHSYGGSAITLHVISPVGEYSQHCIGNDVINDQSPQFVVPAGHWFAATVNEEDSYALCGCTVAPGFDFADFVLADSSQLSECFPQHNAIIDRLTR